MLTRVFAALSLSSPFNFLVFSPFQKIEKECQNSIAHASRSRSFDFPSCFLLFLWNQTVQKIEIQQKYQHFF
uniref:Uncharacterized protein n=1 Tax=Gossypium raimondii TaxID=29730 RepID=A0A0D2QHC5_GOSRA|nr:hypothetical protein B456_003G081900 [Gossypium raimondii]